MDIRVGCCGFPKSQTAYYTQFSLVEVQQTFYKPPRVPTVQRWRQQAPAGFEFAIKAWQLITHPASSPTYQQPGLLLDGPAESYGSFQATPQVMAAWQRTLETALALQATVILFQCPPSLGPSLENITNLVRFFTRVERRGLSFAWEPRGPWPEKTIARLCQEVDLIYATDPFVKRPAPGSVAYFRMHGKSGYGYRYRDDDLRQLLTWCHDYDRVYCLFNNASMWEDSLRFDQMVAAET